MYIYIYIYKYRGIYVQQTHLNQCCHRWVKDVTKLGDEVSYWTSNQEKKHSRPLSHWNDSKLFQPGHRWFLFIGSIHPWYNCSCEASQFIYVPWMESANDLTIYPLVNVCIAVEHHRFTGKTRYFDGHFQQQTVTLPDGKIKNETNWSIRWLGNSK